MNVLKSPAAVGQTWPPRILANNGIKVLLAWMYIQSFIPVPVAIAGWLLPLPTPGRTTLILAMAFFCVACLSLTYVAQRRWIGGHGRRRA